MINKWTDEEKLLFVAKNDGEESEIKNQCIYD